MAVLYRALRSRWTWAVVLVSLGIAGALKWSVWWEPVEEFVKSTISSTKKSSPLDNHDHAANGEHEDAHAHEDAHDEGSSLTLSDKAQANIGLTADSLTPIQLETFRRSITVPGLVVERPGRTRVEISTPMAAVITHVHAVEGEAVRPGTLLFQLRITAESLVSTQTDLLRTVGELDIENREITRLSKASEAGAISQKTLLERQYAKGKLEVLLNTQREALRLHGLSEQQIDDIATNRRLLRDLQIVAPSRDTHGPDEFKLSSSGVQPVSLKSRIRDEQAGQSAAAGHTADDHQSGNSNSPLILRDVLVHKGETVAAGATLAVLADYSELYIEGRGFEQDSDLLLQSGRNNWKVGAVFDGTANTSKVLDGLDFVYSANEVDVESRSLSFFVALPNRIAREVPSPNGQRFIDWEYRPGQRVQLRVPVEEWVDQIVLPVEALAREGAESFVFQQNGAHFDRVSVHVKYRDSSHAVIANDGTLFPGDVVARLGAHQMQMALKNKSGGGADPHAGHNH